ncbi:BBE domain-containing protein [Streptomyces erythrogriseus]
MERLRGIKRCYDPHNLFRDNFNIIPNPGEQAAPVPAPLS